MVNKIYLWIFMLLAEEISVTTPVVDFSKKVKRSTEDSQ